MILQKRLFKSITKKNCLEFLVYIKNCLSLKLSFYFKLKNTNYKNGIRLFTRLMIFLKFNNKLLTNKLKQSVKFEVEVKSFLGIWKHLRLLSYELQKKKG